MHHLYAVVATTVSDSLVSDSRWPQFGGRAARMQVTRVYPASAIEAGEELLVDRHI